MSTQTTPLRPLVPTGPAQRGRAVAAFMAISLVLVSVLVAPFAVGAFSGDALGGVVPVGQFIPLIASLIVWKWLGDGQPLSRVWALRPGAAKRLWLGLAAVTAAIAAVGTVQAVAAWAIGAEVSLRDGFWTTVPLAFALAVVMAIPCFGEEVGWRGHLFALLDRWPGWTRVLITSVLWSLWHVPLMLGYLSLHQMSGREALAATLNVVAGGLVLGWVREISGSVWPAVWGHALLNTLMVHLASTVTTGTMSDALFWGYQALGWGLWVAAGFGLSRLMRRRSDQVGAGWLSVSKP